MVILLAGVYAASIQDDDGPETGLHEGDWIPADEEGVAPAVAPADIVRIAERVAETLSTSQGDDGAPTSPEREAQVLPAKQRRLSSRSRPAASIDFPIDLSPTDLGFAPLPLSASSTSTRPGASARHQIAPARVPHDVPPLHSVIPQFSPLMSLEDSPPVIPALQIGFSAISPGFPALRKRTRLGPARRSVSEGFSGDLEGRHRRMSVSTVEGEGAVDEHAGLSRVRFHDDSAVRGREESSRADHSTYPAWLWGVVSWPPGRRKKPSPPGEDTG